MSHSVNRHIVFKGRPRDIPQAEHYAEAPETRPADPADPCLADMP